MSLSADLHKVEAFFNLKRDYEALLKRVEELEAKLGDLTVKYAEKVSSELHESN